MQIQPIKLEPERAWRTYLGGKMIDDFHSKVTEDSNFPEEWLMSIVSAKNPGREHIVEGMSRTKDGITLKSIIEGDPEYVLGKKFYERHGATTGVLVKLLDAGERLTVQVHPTREMARELFNSEFGKTECWHILKTREDIPEPACIYLGFREGISRELWRECFEKQDIGRMLGCLNKIEVKEGETYLIHGGVPHAIGQGCFLVEIQEPTDLTIRTEIITPSGLRISDMQCHQGLGFDRMFDCFSYDGVSEERARELWCLKPETSEKDGCRTEEIVGYKATPMFRLQRITVNRDSSCILGDRDVFCGLYVLDGKGHLNSLDAEKGEQFFLPAGTDEVKISADEGTSITLLRYFGPKCS